MLPPLNPSISLSFYSSSSSLVVPLSTGSLILWLFLGGYFLLFMFRGLFGCFFKRAFFEGFLGGDILRSALLSDLVQGLFTVVDVSDFFPTAFVAPPQLVQYMYSLMRLVRVINCLFHFGLFIHLFGDPFVERFSVPMCIAKCVFDPFSPFSLSLFFGCTSLSPLFLCIIPIGEKHAILNDYILSRSQGSSLRPSYCPFLRHNKREIISLYTFSLFPAPFRI